MLCAIRDSDKIKVIARSSKKVEGPFYCPGCKREVNVKKGAIKTHHFAHKPPYKCRYGAGESDAHRNCKETIFNKLCELPHVSLCELEKNFGDNVADIYAEINGVPVAIEIQKSDLTVNEISKRTRTYHEKGIYVLWLCLLDKKLNNQAYSPKAWEKWLHAVYFGRVYYWLSDLVVVPFHFGDYQTYIESSVWFDSSGHENSSGGYFKTSRRYKTPMQGVGINIGSNFKPSYKSAWNSKTIKIPECSIYSDNLKAWWKDKKK
ncbi:competence protein CoiA [Kistimonas asteriae]|uniref:competence protein CoiA n=1 Tax=Kistimonas asteriae TaxID=517724 RepID=UPI001BABB384|nr:competence protein CoiA family protein [Kistimonas asteriae]